jgi:hypothetical protein
LYREIKYKKKFGRLNKLIYLCIKLKRNIMKKILAIIAISTFLFLSCEKKPKNITCDVVQCEFGQNMQTCLCNPNPNDTTNVPDPNDTTDTPTNPIIVSKFGNGSNGTIDTTQSYMDFKGYNKNSLYAPNNTYVTLHEVLYTGSRLEEVETNAYEVLKNGVYINVPKQSTHLPFLQISVGNLFWVSCDDVLPITDPDRFSFFFYALSLADYQIVNSYNETTKAFVAHSSLIGLPSNYVSFKRFTHDINYQPISEVDLPHLQNEYRVKPIVKNGQKHFYLVFKFKYENDFFEVRTMVK